MNTIQMYPRSIHHTNLGRFFYLITYSLHQGTSRINYFYIHNPFDKLHKNLFIGYMMFKMANFNLICSITQHHNRYPRNSLYLFDIPRTHFLCIYLICNVNFLCNIFLVINLIGHQVLIHNLHQTFFS